MTDNSLDSITSKLLLMERYETAYSICNHEAVGRDRPLAIVALHQKENVAEYSRLYQIVYRFSKQKIGELFHIGLLEFLSLPREMVELLFKISTDATAAELPGLERIVREIKTGHK